MINLLSNKYSIELAYNLTVPDSSDYGAEFSPIINEISAMNTIAPIYLFAQTTQTKELAYQIKDLSTSIREQVASIFSSSEAENCEKTYQYYSNAPKCISLETLSSPVKGEFYKLHINNVADGQINTGKSVPLNSCPFRGGTYKFIIEKDNMKYHYQIELESTSTNEDILTAISREIMDSQIGIVCSINTDNNKISLDIHALPNKQDKAASFRILEDGARIIHFYNLNNIKTEPSKSDFSINNEKFSSYGTVFLVDDFFKLHLHSKEKEDIKIYTDEIRIDSKPHIEKLLHTVNTLLQLSIQISEHKLHRELISLIDSCRNDFSNLGIEVNTSYSLDLTDEQNIAPIKEQFLSQENDTILSEVLDCITKISTNPMDYIPKKVVSYPDLSRPNWNKPYQLSNYSGFLFSSYC